MAAEYASIETYDAAIESLNKFCTDILEQTDMMTKLAQACEDNMSDDLSKKYSEQLSGCIVKYHDVVTEANRLAQSLAQEREDLIRLLQEE